jgi:hypothetical protein
MRFPSVGVAAEIVKTSQLNYLAAPQKKSYFGPVRNCFACMYHEGRLTMEDDKSSPQRNSNDLDKS